MGAPSYQYIQEPIRKALDTPTPTENNNVDIAQQLVESIANYVGWWGIIGLVLAGLLFIFKHRIKRAVVAFIKE